MALSAQEDLEIHASMTSEISLKAVDVVFGKRPKAALDLLDQGIGRADILERTGQVVAVADASLTIEQGAFCVLMGLSGSGKSTLLRCINGLNRATRGDVLVRDSDGVTNVAACDIRALRQLRTQKIAMVFQQFALLPWRTVEENVGFGLELRGMKLSERSRIIQDCLELVGLQQWRERYASALSGGMQQRVGLARAFATNADILLMDEPFSALDPLIRTRLQNELLDLQKKLKKTIVFVSHDLDEAMKLGSHIVIMEDGRLVQQGGPETIVLQPANRYVADFVAQMNPLNVLRGLAVMTPVDAIPRNAGQLLLDSGGRTRLHLNGANIPTRGVSGGRSTVLASWVPGQSFDQVEPGSMVSAPASITLKTALELRHRTGNPVLLVDGDQLVGVIGDEEIYRGILRQSSPVAPDSKD